MSDTRYEAMQNEVLAALAGIEGVGSLLAATTVDGLLSREAIRKPAIGVIGGGEKAMRSTEETLSIGQRAQEVVTTLEVSVLVKNERGPTPASTAAQQLLEEIYGKLHFLRSSLAPGMPYVWREDQPVTVPTDDVAAAVSIYELVNLKGA